MVRWLIVVLAIMAAACTGGAVDSGDDPGDEAPPAVGACAEENPDCVDVGVDDGTARCAEGAVDCDDTPGEGGEGVTSGALSPGGGLTVSEALATDATGVLAVKGFLIADATGVHLCEALAESVPPQCGGASVEVSGLTALDELTTSEGDTRWSDSEVVVFGEIADGVLVIDATATG